MESRRVELSPLMRPFAFPPLQLALETDWDRKLSELAARSVSEPITMVSGVPSWLLMLFQRILDATGKRSLAEVWPHLEMVVHGGVKFDPYRQAFQSLLGSPAIRLQETYPCSEGFIAFGDPETGLLRLLYDHRLFYEFVPVDELGSPNPTRHWLGDGTDRGKLRDRCFDVRGDVGSRDRRHRSIRIASPPLISFTGRTRYTLSAFGEHLISEEIEAAMARSAADTEATIARLARRAGVHGAMGYHQFVVEFLKEPVDSRAFRDRLDGELSNRNADYLAHRIPGVGLPPPALIVARSGSFEAWMRRRGKLGGQNKVPRMDNTGSLTCDLVQFLRETDRVGIEVSPIPSRIDVRDERSGWLRREVIAKIPLQAAVFFVATSAAICPIVFRCSTPAS